MTDRSPTMRFATLGLTLFWVVSGESATGRASSCPHHARAFEPPGAIPAIDRNQFDARVKVSAFYHF